MNVRKVRSDETGMQEDLHPASLLAKTLGNLRQS